VVHEWYPALHRHTLWPGVGCTDVAGHDVHDVEPAVGLYVFAKQFVHGPPGTDVCPAEHVTVHEVTEEV